MSKNIFIEDVGMVVTKSGDLYAARHEIIAYYHNTLRNPINEM